MLEIFKSAGYSDHEYYQYCEMYGSNSLVAECLSLNDISFSNELITSRVIEDIQNGLN